MAKLSKVDINNVNLGGIADSAYLGTKNSVDDMLGFDIHDEAGIMKVSQALTKESGTSIGSNEIYAMVACSDGKTYMFSRNQGYIFSRTSGGTYTNEAQSADFSISTAMEYKGYIYYASPEWLGRWQIGTAWSTRTDHWQALTVAYSTYHPMLIVNDVLYIGNDYKLAQVDGTTFTGNALTLETKYSISCLGQMGTDLLMGTANALLQQAVIFRWNTWSVSFTNSDPIPENAINAFLPMDNFVMCNAGTAGNIYTYDGTKLDLYKKVRLSAAYPVLPNAVLNFKGKALFGINVIHSLARTNRNYPFVLNKEVGLSAGNFTTARVLSMVQPSADYYLVAWISGGTYGIDKYDLTAKFTNAYITSRVILGDRYELTNFGSMKVAWRTKPANTAFTLYAKKNNGALTAIGTQLTDTMRNIDYTKEDIGEANTLQVACYVTVSGNNAPEIEGLQVPVQT